MLGHSENKKVLLMGASGFIGTHLIEYILQHNFEVIAYS